MSTKENWNNQEAQIKSCGKCVCLGKDAWGYFNKVISKPYANNVVFRGIPVKIHFVYYPSFIMKKPLVERQEYSGYLSDVIKSAAT